MNRFETVRTRTPLEVSTITRTRAGDESRKPIRNAVPRCRTRSTRCETRRWPSVAFSQKARSATECWLRLSTALITHRQRPWRSRPRPAVRPFQLKR
jgi:hypothetical protein